jgi:two-component system chemotaxis response regulator CheY
MTSPLKLIHVLVVDDDEVQHDLMDRHLERAGVVNRQFAVNGIEALEMLRNELFHVVLTDNTMPGMGGRQLIEAIRGDSLIRHLKVAMLSGELKTTGCAEEAELRAFLWRHNVLPVSKTNLDSAVISQTIRTLVGF